MVPCGVILNDKWCLTVTMHYARNNKYCSRGRGYAATNKLVSCRFVTRLWVTDWYVRSKNACAGYVLKPCHPIKRKFKYVYVETKLQSLLHCLPKQHWHLLRQRNKYTHHQVMTDIELIKFNTEGVNIQLWKVKSYSLFCPLRKPNKNRKFQV